MLGSAWRVFGAGALPAFYEIGAARERWSSRELERQIGALLFERLAKSRDKEKVLALAQHGEEPEGPADVVKDPFVLEFLGLDERAHWRERDLEQAIIDLGLSHQVRAVSDDQRQLPALPARLDRRTAAALLAPHAKATLTDRRLVALGLQ